GAWPACAASCPTPSGPWAEGRGDGRLRAGADAHDARHPAADPLRGRAAAAAAARHPRPPPHADAVAGRRLGPRGDRPRHRAGPAARRRVPDPAGRPRAAARDQPDTASGRPDADADVLREPGRHPVPGAHRPVVHGHLRHHAARGRPHTDHAADPDPGEGGRTGDGRSAPVALRHGGPSPAYRRVRRRTLVVGRWGIGRQRLAAPGARSVPLPSTTTPFRHEGPTTTTVPKTTTAVTTTVSH